MTDFEVRAYWVLPDQAAAERFADELMCSLEPGVVGAGPADDGAIDYCMTRDELMGIESRQIAADLYEANEKMGEALVEIGMALGLPRPDVNTIWGRTAILARIEEIAEALGGR